MCESTVSSEHVESLSAARTESHQQDEPELTLWLLLFEVKLGIKSQMMLRRCLQGPGVTSQT